MEKIKKQGRGRPPVPTPKTSTSFRLSAKGRAILAALSADAGLSQASVVEMALRDMAKSRGLSVAEREEVAA